MDSPDGYDSNKTPPEGGAEDIQPGISAPDAKLKGGSALHADNINNNLGSETTIKAPNTTVSDGSALYANSILNFGPTNAQADPSGDYQLYALSAESLVIPGSGPPPDVASILDGIARRRTLWMLYDGASAKDCARTRVALLKAVAATGRTVVTAPTLDLRRHLAYGDDLKSYQPFVLFFEEARLESVDANIRLLLSDAERSRLQEFLYDCDGLVVAPVSAQVRGHADMKSFDWSGLHVVRIESAAAAVEVERPATPVASWTEPDPIADAICFIAAFMPGLQMAPFDRLMVSLLEAAQPAADAAAETSKKARRLQARGQPVNLAERWKGNADQAVHEAGVAHRPGKFEDGGGYHFMDGEAASSFATMLLERRPSWLARQFDVVVDRLLEDSAPSQAQQQGVRWLWIKLDERGIVTVDSDRLWRLFEKHELQRGNPSAAFESLMGELLAVPSTSDAAFKFLRRVAVRCAVPVSTWSGWIQMQPQALDYVASGGREKAEPLRERLAEQFLQSDAIKQLSTLQSVLVNALSRADLTKTLPILVDATAEHEQQRAFSRQFDADPALRYFTEPARWLLWSLLDDRLANAVHLLPEFCIAAAQHWHQLDAEDAALEHRWRATVLFDAVLRTLDGLLGDYVFRSDADARHDVTMIFDDPRTEEFDKALGLAIATQAGRLRGDEARAARYAPPFGLDTAVGFYGLIVCALQKRDPVRSPATLARVRSLAVALRAAFGVRMRADLPATLQMLEQFYRQQKNDPALSGDPVRRRIWLSRIDAVRELRVARQDH